jgi:hypothetical protein
MIKSSSISINCTIISPTESRSPEVSRPGCEGDHSHPYGVKVKKEWIYNSNTMSLHNLHSDYFTFITLSLKSKRRNFSRILKETGITLGCKPSQSKFVPVHVTKRSSPFSCYVLNFHVSLQWNLRENLPNDFSSFINHVSTTISPSNFRY